MRLRNAASSGNESYVASSYTSEDKDISGPIAIGEEAQARFGCQDLGSIVDGYMLSSIWVQSILVQLIEDTSMSTYSNKTRPTHS